ncbi:uncharacterized protein LOC142368716 [Odontesthes bonariensis]|uniref:uncharacterized protein LOC142368716 n=1 Tax=Odontesthes bonariensis TaxID=219752 RepID=UPI003F584032
MEIASLCLLLSATLSILPNRSQFFWYDTITLSCGEAGNSGNWIIKRNTSHDMFEPCNAGWGMSNETSCTIVHAYPSDTGVYWCESEQGECSNSLKITITDGVILHSPALPVTEGDKVTLLCYYKEQHHSYATFNFSANFYKDVAFIGTQPLGNMTFSAVSTSDEGFYKCEYPAKGESPQALLAVRSKVRTQPPLPMSLPRLICTILLLVLYTVLLIVCVNVHRAWAKARAEAKRASDHLSQPEQ